VGEIDYVTVFVFFKQKTAYEFLRSDWSSDVCSSDSLSSVSLRINTSFSGRRTLTEQPGYSCHYEITVISRLSRDKIS
jgi:hypothetical protein